MAAPVSPDDQMRVQKTFDEVAGPVRRPHFAFLLNIYIWSLQFIKMSFSSLAGWEGEFQGAHGAV